jgi:hypothetical protein
MTLLFTLLLLAGLAGLVYVYRDKIEGFLPGFKSYAFNGLLLAGGAADYVLQYLQTVDWGAKLGPFIGDEKAALAAVAIGAIGMMISYVTKRVKGDASTSSE